MKKLKTILVDDESKAREMLELLLNRFKQIEIVGIASSVKACVDLLNETTCDLLFLDIELGDGTGFDILKEVNRVNFQVVFTTAYNEFAIDAFKVNAIDYILKPIEEAELRRVVQKVEDVLENKSSEQLIKLGEFVNKNDKNDVLFIHEQGHISFIKLDDIYFFKAEGQYTVIMLKDSRSKTSSQNLGYYEKIIESDQFFRIHRSYMINLNYVSGLSTADQQVELSNGQNVPFSNQHKEAFLEKMKAR